MASSTSTSSYNRSTSSGGGGHYLESSSTGRPYYNNRSSSYNKSGSYNTGPPVRHHGYYYNNSQYGKRQLSAVDVHLREKSLKRKYMAKDGCCLFRAVAEQVWLVQSSHWTLRRHCAHYIKSRKDHFKSFLTVPVEDYCFKLSNSSMWGGEMELVALSELLDCYIEVYSEEKGEVNVRKFNEKKKAVPGCKHVLLAYTGSNHYDSVWKESDERAFGFCQSIVYELLFSDVFEDDWLTQKAKPLKLNEIHNNEHTIRHVSCDVLKALSSYVYSNIPLELCRLERQAREFNDRKYASDLQYTVGTACQVFIDGNSYNAEITSSNSYPKIQVKLFGAGPRGKRTYNVSTKQITFSSSTRPLNGGNDKGVTQSDHSKKSYSSKITTTPTANRQSSLQSSTTNTTTATASTTTPTASTTPLPITTNSTTVRSLGNKEGNSKDNKMTHNNREAKAGSNREVTSNNREGIIPAGVSKEERTTTNSKHTIERSSNKKTRTRDQPHPSTKSNNRGEKNDGVVERSITPTKRSTTPTTKNSVVQQRSSNEKGVGKKYSSQHPLTSNTDNITSTGSATHEITQPLNDESNAYYVTLPPVVVTNNGPHSTSTVPHSTSTVPTTNISGSHSTSTVLPTTNISGSTSTVPTTNISGSHSNVPTTNISGSHSNVPTTNISGSNSTVPTTNLGSLIFNGPPIIGPTNDPRMITTITNSPPFVNGINYYVPSLENKEEEEVPSFVNDAPECEWPILNSCKSTEHNNTLHIDGPPPPTVAVMGQAPPTTTINHQLPPSMMYSHFIFSELEPPLHLLRNKTPENKQAFLIEYAQKCLRFYAKYISDEELEDTLEDLMCMSSDDIIRHTTPPRYNDGQFSVASSSQANSELTEDRETTPNEPHPSLVGTNGIVSSPPHSDDHTSSPLIERKEDIEREEEEVEEMKELIQFPPMAAATAAPFMYSPIPMMLPPHGFLPYPFPFPPPHPGGYRMPPVQFYPNPFFPPPPYFPGGPPYNEDINEGQQQQENKDEDDDTTNTTTTLNEDSSLNNKVHDSKTTPIDVVPMVTTSEQSDIPFLSISEIPPTTTITTASSNEKIDQLINKSVRPFKQRKHNQTNQHKNHRQVNKKRTLNHHSNNNESK